MNEIYDEHTDERNAAIAATIAGWREQEHSAPSGAPLAAMSSACIDLQRVTGEANRRDKPLPQAVTDVALQQA